MIIKMTSVTCHIFASVPSPNATFFDCHPTIVKLLCGSTTYNVDHIPSDVYLRVVVRPYDFRTPSIKSS